MKAKDGVFKFSNGYITLFFLSCNHPSFANAIQTNDMDALIEASCLQLDSDGHCISSNWNHVRCEYDLIKHLQRERLNPG